MSLFRSFVRKEFLHILRDPRTMLILLGMPVVQILLFGFAISVEIRGINLAIVAPVQSETLRQITAKIEANPYFTVVAPAATAVEAESLLRNGTVDLVLRFPPDFDARLAHADATAQLSVDASNPNTAVAEQLYLQQIVAGYFASQSSVYVATAPAIQPNLHLLYNPRMESAYNFVPGILGLILILICAMMTSVSIVREKEVGTMEVLLVSPVRPLTLILSKMVPYFLLSCASLSLILLLSRFVLHVPLAGSLWGICALSLLYILLSLALGLLISTLVRTQMAAMLGSVMALLLPVLMLSGMIFPIESAPRPFQVLSCLIPARWYIAAMRKLMIEGLPLHYVLREFCILSAMTFTLIAIALANFKNRLS